MKTSIIKAGHFHLPSEGMYSLDLRDISKQAAGMLEAARLEAQRILEESRSLATREREQLAHEAQRRGYAEGLAKGQEAGFAASADRAAKQFAEDQAALISALTTLVKDFKSVREQLLLDARRDVIVLAITIASRIVSGLTEVDGAASSIVSQACTEALELIGEATDVAIRANPEDLVTLERLCSELAASTQSGRHLRLIGDATVSRGGVVVDSSDSSVDATVNERIRRIADELADGWRGRQGELSIQS